MGLKREKIAGPVPDEAHLGVTSWQIEGRVTVEGWLPRGAPFQRYALQDVKLYAGLCYPDPPDRWRASALGNLPAGRKTLLIVLETEWIQCGKAVWVARVFQGLFAMQQRL